MAEPGPPTTQASDANTTVDAAMLLLQGKRHLLVQDYPSAVISLQDACKLLGAKYGETANECGEAYLCYGKALLELARQETGVLGNALEDESPSEEEDGEEEEGEANQEGQTEDDAAAASNGQSEGTLGEEAANASSMVVVGAEEKDVNGENNKVEENGEGKEEEKADKAEEKDDDAEKVPNEQENSDRTNGPEGAQRSEVEKTESMETEDEKNDEEGGKKERESDEGKKKFEGAKEEVTEKDQSEVCDVAKKDEKKEVQMEEEMETLEKEVSEAKKEAEVKDEGTAATDTEQKDKMKGEMETKNEDTKADEVSEEDAEVKEDKLKDTVEQKEDTKQDEKEGDAEEKKGEASTEAMEVDKTPNTGREASSKEEEKVEDAEEDLEKEEPVLKEDPHMSAEPGTSASGPQEKVDEEEVSNLQLAWEVLELAKVIFKRQVAEGKTEALAKVAEVLLKLGEISIESDNCGQAVEDLSECLAVQREILAADSRQLAETHYQRGLAHSFAGQYDSAADDFRAAVGALELRVENLSRFIDENKDKEREGSLDDDPVWRAEREVEDLRSLLPEVKAKVEDAEDMMRQDCKALKDAAIQKMMAREPATSPVKSTASGAEPPVNVITHLIKRKRTSEGAGDGSAASPLKKQKADSTAENGESNTTGDSTENEKPVSKMEPVLS